MQVIDKWLADGWYGLGADSIEDDDGKIIAVLLTKDNAGIKIRCPGNGR